MCLKFFFSHPPTWRVKGNIMLSRIAMNVFELESGIRTNSFELVHGLNLVGVSDVSYRNLAEYRGFSDDGDSATLTYVDRLEIVLDQVERGDFRKVRNCFGGSVVEWMVEADGDGQVRWCLNLQYTFVAKLDFEQVELLP